VRGLEIARRRGNAAHRRQILMTLAKKRVGAECNGKLSEHLNDVSPKLALHQAGVSARSDF